MTDQSSKLLEARLMSELTAVKRRIEELETEKRGLERLIVRVRREEVANREVGRKNSARRILVEKAVLDRLEAAQGKLVSSGELFRSVSQIEFNLNESTFRSYLHRMKTKGLIETSGPLVGRYKLPRPKLQQAEG